MALSPNDPSSYSRPDVAVTTKLHLSLKVDFSKHTLSGLVRLKGTKVDPNAKELILDVKEIAVFYVKDTLNGKDLKYEIGPQFKDIGSQLSIDIENVAKEFEVEIGYETSPSANGLQWLTPNQTAGKVHPFMFSQGQPTEMRSIVPCQDTPSIKIPYSADISAPKALTVLMSALRVKVTDNEDNTRTHYFNQPVNTPTYLIAIAIGDLQSRELGPRSNVWAEPSIVEQAQWEFAETEKMLQTAESICGPYVWGQYDLLVLPPSFPYGGMENPCLTFLTPSVIAGDRSLVSVIAHEISHSWTGNLVTNANFEHFWLNEGFTVFVERKILGRLRDSNYRDFSTLVGLTELQDTIDTMGKENPLTKLVVDLPGIHPDEAFSIVPYEKGSLFLRYLEQSVGGTEIFEKFLLDYLKHFEYKSIKTDDFKQYFIQKFPSVQIDWDKWLTTPGMPIIIPELNKSMLEAITVFANQWIDFDKNGGTAPAYVEYSTKQMCQFLNRLTEVEKLKLTTLKKLDEVFKLDEKKNCEIRTRWLRLCIRFKWEEKTDLAIEFVNSVGRMKYLNPIYRELYNSGDKTRDAAITNFNKHKDELMLVAQKAIIRILHL